MLSIKGYSNLVRPLLYEMPPGLASLYCLRTSCVFECGEMLRLICKLPSLERLELLENEDDDADNGECFCECEDDDDECECDERTETPLTRFFRYTRKRVEPETFQLHSLISDNFVKIPITCRLHLLHHYNKQPMPQLRETVGGYYLSSLHVIKMWKLEGDDLEQYRERKREKLTVKVKPTKQLKLRHKPNKNNNGLDLINSIMTSFIQQKSLQH